MKPNAQVGYPAPPTVVNITPDMAMRWLESNTHNRRISQPKVERYSRDMKLGRWIVTHQGIAFSKDGTLLDGQHRLWAVIDSGATVPMLVHHGLSMEAQTVIDTMAPRDTACRLSLSDQFGDVTPMEAGALKLLLKGVGTHKQTTVAEEVELFAKHRAAIEFAVNAFPGRRKRVTIGPVYAVVARAWYSADREKLSRFCYVLFSNEPETAAEKTVIALREALLEGTKNAVAYLKCSSALRAYLQGKTITKIYPASEELFLLPEDSSAKPVKYARERYDVLDRIMGYMRLNRRSNVRGVVEGLGMARTKNAKVKAAMDRAVGLGWLQRVKADSVRSGATYSIISR